MRASQSYTPALKARRSDVAAYAKLTPNSRATIKPLFEVPLRPKDCTLDEHLSKSVDAIKSLQPTDLFFDPYGFLPGERLDDRSLVEVRAFASVAATHHKVTPVYGLERSPDVWSQIPRVVKQCGNGFAFRLTIYDLQSAPTETWDSILSRAEALNLPPTAADLFLDARDLGGADLDVTREAILDFLAESPATFRSLTLLGSSARKSVAGIEVEGTLRIVRQELLLWARLRYELADHAKIIFGDYGVIRPDLVIAGPNPNANAKIRYTSGSATYVFRGHGLYRPVSDFGQYHELASRVVRSRQYKGPDFSWGDLEIQKRSDPESRPGNLATWVGIDIIDHLETAASQLTNLQPMLERADRMMLSRRSSDL